MLFFKKKKKKKAFLPYLKNSYANYEKNVSVVFILSRYAIKVPLRVYSVDLGHGFSFTQHSSISKYSGTLVRKNDLEGLEMFPSSSLLFISKKVCILTF